LTKGAKALDYYRVSGSHFKTWRKSDMNRGLVGQYPIMLGLPLLAIALAGNVSCSVVIAQVPRLTPEQKLRTAQSEVESSPRDPKKRFELAEAMRLSGNIKEAAIEYLDVTSLEPAYYIAYHQLVRSKPTEDELDEAVDRLKKLEEKRPKNLMLRVALSEVLERKGDLYGAARALVDLQYSHGIPEKYQMKVNSRIHYLLSKAKDIASSKTAQHSQGSDEDADATPLPLPESGFDTGLSATQLKDPKVPEGYGHARLLP
jgi:tetratricopeptide (TPR) repeat protein